MTQCGPNSSGSERCFFSYYLEECLSTEGLHAKSDLARGYDKIRRARARARPTSVGTL